MGNNHCINNLCIFSFIKVVDLWEVTDVSFIWIRQSFLREDVLLESFWRPKGSISERRGYMKTQWARRWSTPEFGRLWRRWWCISAVVVLTGWKEAFRSFKEALWSLLQYRKLSRCWFRSNLVEELTCKKEVDRGVPLKTLLVVLA